MTQLGDETRQLQQRCGTLQNAHMCQADLLDPLELDVLGGGVVFGDP